MWLLTGQMRMVTWILLLHLLVGPVRAGHEEVPATPEFLAAEHQRLSDDILQLARRQLWPGVERKFQECEMLGLDLSYDDLLNGAYAARAMGNAQAAYDRLRRAARLNPSKEVVDWLWNIDSTYGHVELGTTPPRSIELGIKGLPFAPDQRAAVDFAVATMQRDGYFRGLLPKGNYTLGDEVFAVQPGVSIRIEVSSRKKTDARPEEGAADPALPPPTGPIPPPPAPIQEDTDIAW